jgi:hypothetical protein
MLRVVFVLLALVLVATVVAGQDIECVGDRGTGCPVLTVSEETRPDPGCQAPQQVEHGSVMWVFKGVVGREAGGAFLPIPEVRILRECLDDAGRVVRSCPVKVKFARDGSFSASLWRKRVDETTCRDNVLTTRVSEERVRLRFEAVGCQDLLVLAASPAPSKPLVMKCGPQK